MQPKRESLWGSWATAINVLTFLAGICLLLWLIIFPVMLLNGDALSFDSDPDGKLCVKTGNILDNDEEGIDSGAHSETLGTPKPNAEVRPTDLQVCVPTEGLDDKPVKWGLKVLIEASMGAVYLGLLLGTRRIMKSTDRAGAFGREQAHMVTQLGWWVLGGFIVATVVKTAAGSLLLGTMLVDTTWGWVDLDFPGMQLLGAIGIIVAGNLLGDRIPRTPADPQD